MKQPLYRISPIGGVGEIGANMTHIKSKDVSFIIDCGIMFPSDDCYGINFLIPLIEDSLRPNFIIITHGHEDHIGAITFLIEKFPDIPIYAPAFARELILSKISYSNIKSPKIILYSRDEVINYDGVTIHPIQLNHSIPDTYGLYIKANDCESSIFFASDFKVDHSSPYGEQHQLKRLEELSKNDKQKFLLADSTNITSANERALSENDLVYDLNDLISHPGRVFVTTFSSNVFRIKTIINCAINNHKKVVLYGRSTKHYFKVASKLGLISKKEQSQVIDVESINRDQKNIVVVVSGCQGDFKSALRRVAFNTDKFFKLNENDLFLFSSKTIPGSEKKVMMSINEIVKSGAKVITSRDRQIHASGHACKKDLEDLYNAYTPTHLIPIHGEHLFLERHSAFGIKNKTQTIEMKNNCILDIFEDGHRFLEKEEKEFQLVTGERKIIDRDYIRERRKVAQNGLIIVNRFKNEVSAKTYGFFKEAEAFSNQFANDFKNLRNSLEYEQKVKTLIRQKCQAQWGIKPIVIVNQL